MNDPVDRRIRQVVHEIHDSAPATPEWSQVSTAWTRVPQPPRRGVRGWVVAATAAVLAATLTTGVLVARSTSDRSRPATSRPGPTSTPSEPVATSSPPTTAPSEPEPDTASTWTDVSRARWEALSGFDSVSFTVDVTERYAANPEQDSTNTRHVTLRSDGSVWSTGDGLIFNSYDATTGIARLHARQPDGSILAEQVAGETGNSIAFLMLGGTDPTGGIHWSPDAVVSAGTHDGRPAWTLTQTIDDQIDTWTIDQPTGLIVGHETDWTYAGTARAHRSVSLTDLRTGVELPAEFPGELPPDADVQQIGDPSSKRLTLDEAAAQFGSGFVVPGTLPPDSTVVADTFGPTDPATDQTFPSTQVSVTITLADGFARSTLVLTKLRAPDDGIPAGFVAVDDRVCRSDDGTTCAGRPGDLVITSGAWAGTTAAMNGLTLVAERDGVILNIVAADATAALAIADTLTSLP